ncbi:MAG: acyl-CoA thioesterase [Ignavibacteria bacterium]|nr:acyl-CoA thioesterase [Ignavibacteria bacterium]
MRFEDIKPEFLSKFKHNIAGKVRFHEVDSFGVVHNLVYFYWMEIAQTEYFEKLGFDISPQTFTRDFPLMKVHNEIDYFFPLRLGDTFQVLTRISWIKKTSFEYQNLILNNSGNPSAFGRSILVHLNPKSLQPEVLPKRFVDVVRLFEGENVEQLKDLNGPE